jgi:hypothetical protein
MRKFLAVAGSLLVASGEVPAGEVPRSQPARRPTATIPAPGSNVTVQPSVLDHVSEKYRDAVSAVLKSPSMSAKAEEEEFTANEKIYDWLIEHPDRACLAWQRLKVPCLDITDHGKSVFKWSDDSGSELAWQTVGKFENGTIWYATGKVKAGTLIPTVPVKAVAILTAPRSADKDGASTFKPSIQLFVLTDSRVAATVMRVVGPAAPKMAEQGAEQLLFFFSGIARYTHKKPEQMEALLAPKK